DLLYLDINQAFDPVSNLWLAKAAMPTPRETFAMSEVNGIIYVAGGEVFNNCTPIQTLEAYDPVKDSWTTLPDMPTARWNMNSGGSINGMFYVIGGQAGCGSALNVVEAFDP